VREREKSLISFELRRKGEEGECESKKCKAIKLCKLIAMKPIQLYNLQLRNLRFEGSVIF
jgi:hypothetical protein